MSDQDLRRLARLAETQGDAASWERVARAYERDARILEAQDALARARELGADTRTAEESLEALPWTALAPRELALGQPGGTTEIAWSSDGRTLFAAMGEHFVLAFDPATGERRTVASLRGIVGAVAAEPRGTGLLVVTLEESPSSRPVSRLSLVREDARNPEWTLELPGAVRSLALVPRQRALVWLGFRNRVFVHRTDETGRPAAEPLWDGFRVGHTGEGDLVRFATAAAPFPRQGPRPPGEPSSLATAEVLSPADGLALPAVVESAPMTETARGLVESALLSARFPTARAFLRFAASPRLRDHATGAFATARALALSPSGRNVAIASARDKTLKVADLAGEDVSRTFSLGDVAALTWSPDGRSLAVATDLGLYVLESPPDPRAALESEWRAIQAQHGAGKSAFFSRLEQDPRPEVTDWLLRRIEPPYKDEPIVLDVLDAVHGLQRRRAPMDVARLERIRRQLPARRGFPGLGDYREEVDWLIEVARSVERGERCHCGLAFPTPRHHGQLEREGKTEGGAVLYRCRVCGRRFHVEDESEREGSGRFTITRAEPGNEATG